MVERIEPREHVVAHMGQNEPLRFDFGQMGLQRFQAEVILHDLVVIVSFGDEQVGVACERDQRLRPFGVGALGDDAAFGLDPVGEKRTAGFAVHHRKRRDIYRAECARFPRLESDHRQIKPLLRFG